MPYAESTVLVGTGLGLFFVVWVGLMLIGLGGFVLGIAALINVATTPSEAFGPWWDNTRQAWIIGIAVSFVIPAGPLVAGIMWFTAGRRGLHSGVAGRPFWAGAPRPAPPAWGPPPAPPPSQP